jgi:BirA family biotin operon repressor/biotin-[acetyl-CoA-carboxylase] ligase
MGSAATVHRVFDVPRIERETFVRRVEYHRAVPSTNTRALELAARAEMPVPALVLAEEQTAGRGRGANAWWSAPGALTFSLLLDPGGSLLRPEAWPRVALAAAVGIGEALEAEAPGAAFGIRWPNDVCRGLRKICGILPELTGPRHLRLVLGIGINVNNAVESAPELLRETATSLRDISGREHDLTGVLVSVLQRLAPRLEQLAAGESALRAEWSRRCLLRGRVVRLRMEGDEVSGMCRGIGADGALELQTSRGLERFYGGVITGAEAPGD